MKTMKIQQGFSLIEVLVALLLMSMVFLGFLAVQLKANHATKDADKRTQAVAAMATQAEIIRQADERTVMAYASMFEQLNRTLGDSISMLDAYQKALDAVQTIDCAQAICDDGQLVNYRALSHAKLIAKDGIRLNMLTNGVSGRFIAAWGDTQATQGKGGCIDDKGEINLGATCMTMVY